MLSNIKREDVQVRTWAPKKPLKLQRFSLSHKETDQPILILPHTKPFFSLGQ